MKLSKRIDALPAARYVRLVRNRAARVALYLISVRTVQYVRLNGIVSVCYWTAAHTVMFDNI